MTKCKNCKGEYNNSQQSRYFHVCPEGRMLPSGFKPFKPKDRRNENIIKQKKPIPIGRNGKPKYYPKIKAEGKGIE